MEDYLWEESEDVIMNTCPECSEPIPECDMEEMFKCSGCGSDFMKVPRDSHKYDWLESIGILTRHRPKILNWDLELKKLVEEGK